MPFVPHTKEEVRQMLDVIGVKSLDDLFADIKQPLRPKSFNIPEGLSEMETRFRLQDMASKNRADVLNFLGGGFYDHHIPSAVDAIVSRGEFYTAYTPYQPESSQGTLQAIFEYQTAVTRLMELDCANASVYDGGSAIFESMMMAVRHTKRHKLVIDETVNPLWRAMAASYVSNLGIEIVTVPHKNGQVDFDALKAAVDSSCAAVVVQNPNFFGCINDFSELFSHARSVKAVSILSVYPVMQAVLKTPGAMGADVAVADGQSIGQPLSFGGPYLGVMTCRKDMIRQFPGRIAGRTTDLEGRTGYVLTLQAREQHIRRAKATSNICSNQALCALRSLIHLCLLGPEGLTRVAELSMQNARKAAKRLTALPGVKLLNDAPYGNEFAVVLPVSAADLAEKAAAKGLVPGLPLGRFYKGMDNALLLAFTEKHCEADIDALAKMVGALL